MIKDILDVVLGITFLLVLVGIVLGVVGWFSWFVAGYLLMWFAFERLVVAILVLIVLFNGTTFSAV